MAKVIKMDLSSSSIDDAIKALKSYRDSIDAKKYRLLEELTKIGLREASVRFTTAMYDGVNDSTVRAELTHFGYTIIAEGHAVAFIEFGTGVHYPDIHPMAGELGIAHGTYGKGLGQNDYWFYTGQPGTAGGVLANGHSNTTITHGNPANMCMYYASKEMRDQVERIAKEVFTND